jgi:hypothetical protein
MQEKGYLVTAGFGNPLLLAGLAPKRMRRTLAYLVVVFSLQAIPSISDLLGQS